MFKNNFIKLCNERGESPSAVCRKVNIAPATFSCWNDDSVPRTATLQRIADYFGVTPEYLLRDNEEKPNTEHTFISYSNEDSSAKTFSLNLFGSDKKEPPKDAAAELDDLWHNIEKLLEGQSLNKESYQVVSELVETFRRTPVESRPALLETLRIMIKLRGI